MAGRLREMDAVGAVSLADVPTADEDPSVSPERTEQTAGARLRAMDFIGAPSLADVGSTTGASDPEPAGASPPLFCAGDKVRLTAAAVESYRRDGHDFADAEANAIGPGETGEVGRVYEYEGQWWAVIGRQGRSMDYPAADLEVCVGDTTTPRPGQSAAAIGSTVMAGSAAAAGSASSLPQEEPAPNFCVGDSVMLRDEALPGYDFDDPLCVIRAGEAGEVGRLYLYEGTWWATLTKRAPDGSPLQSDYPAADLKVYAPVVRPISDRTVLMVWGAPDSCADRVAARIGGVLGLPVLDAESLSMQGLEGRITAADCKAGVIFHCFPRSGADAERLDSVLEGLGERVRCLVAVERTSDAALADYRQRSTAVFRNYERQRRVARVDGDRPYEEVWADVAVMPFLAGTGAAADAAVSAAAARGEPLFCAGDRVVLTREAVTTYERDGHDFMDQSLNAIVPGEVGEAARLYECDGDWWVTVAARTEDGALRQCDYPAADLGMAPEEAAEQPAEKESRQESLPKRRVESKRPAARDGGSRRPLNRLAFSRAAPAPLPKSAPLRLSPKPDSAEQLARIRGHWLVGDSERVEVDGADVTWSDGKRTIVHCWPVTATSPARVCVCGWTLHDSSTAATLVWTRGRHQRVWNRCDPQAASQRRRSSKAGPGVLAASSKGPPRGGYDARERSRTASTSPSVLSPSYKRPVGGFSTAPRAAVRSESSTAPPPSAHTVQVKAERKLQADTASLHTVLDEYLSRSRVVIFTKSTERAGDCSWFRQYKVPFERVDMDKMAAEDCRLLMGVLSKRSHQGRLPQIYVDGMHVRTAALAKRMYDGS
eukprot:TRINITY_DN1241_c4_g1_i1.p1 TRINITY_DN1241_c4_g1~~TRINITY_DN1241_c4_g1_i1.p1  ORF type:complete len:847 (+),score=309.45 TRINITY_DN1241_c4_g1_i1:61-2541(+)